MTEVIYHFERPHMAAETGEEGIWCEQFRIRTVRQVGEAEITRQSAPDWQYLTKGQVTHVLERNFSRPGLVSEGWVINQLCTSRDEAMEYIAVAYNNDRRRENGKWPILPNAVIELVTAWDAAAAKRREEERQKEEARARAEEKARHRAASEAAFAKLSESPNAEVQALAQKWVELVEWATPRKDELAQDAEFMRLYEAVMAATTVPTKRKALKAICAKYGPAVVV